MAGLTAGRAITGAIQATVAAHKSGLPREWLGLPHYWNHRDSSITPDLRQFSGSAIACSSRLGNGGHLYDIAAVRYKAGLAGRKGTLYNATPSVTTRSTAAYRSQVE